MQNGRIIDPPVLFEEAVGVVDEPRSPKARSIIKIMNESVRSGNDDQFQTLKKQFEQAFFVPPAAYDLVAVKYDPVERFKNKTLEIRVIKQFNYK
jgi:hypothetical protein